MAQDFIDYFSTTLDSVPLHVRYGVDSEDGGIYLIHVMTQTVDDLMGILSKDAILALEKEAEKVYAQVVKRWNDDALIARSGE
jgi:hypothetical protein